MYAIEYAIQKSETDAILQTDAENAFVSFKRDLALKNIEMLFRQINLRWNLNFQVSNTVLTSTEGTTEDDPLAMALYGRAIIPLIELLKKKTKRCYPKMECRRRKLFRWFKEPPCNTGQDGCAGKRFRLKCSPTFHVSTENKKTLSGKRHKERLKYYNGRWF